MHIHGYFGLTNNRRGLIWPGDECQNDETAEWNELLLTEIGSEVYRKMLQVLVTNEVNTATNLQERSQMVYNSLPDLEKVRGHWRCILDPLFEKLKTEKLFLADHGNAKTWVISTDGIFDRLSKSGTDENVRRAIIKMLQENSQKVTMDVPNHVFSMVEEYFSTPTVIDPSLVRNVLKTGNLNELSRLAKAANITICIE